MTANIELPWGSSLVYGRGNMTILGWIFFGLIVGIVGKLLMPGKDPAGFLVTVA
jgi:hypothetical protein